MHPLDLSQLRQRRNNKWRLYPADVLPAWVADMDFPVAEPIHRYLRTMVEASDFGYSLKPPNQGLNRALIERMQRRYGWEFSSARIEILADVIQGVYIALETLGEKGQGTVIQTPAYPPLLLAAEETGRSAILNPLVATADSYVLDLNGLDESIAEHARFLLLCNPHNPTGRVFTRDELSALAELALRRDLIILSDEIHADLTYPGQTHIPVATLGPEVAERTVTFTSATKAFNIAGLRCAVAIFGSEALHRQFNRLSRGFRGGLNAFGVEATRIAWSECDDWLESVRDYLEINRDRIAEFIPAKLPGVVYRIPESTYFAWIDCRALNLDEEPYDFFLREAKVALMPGPNFGPNGSGWTRINFATSERILNEVLERMASALARR